MRKYSSSPKAIADALKASIPVSEAAALGEDWKKLPPKSVTRSKAARKNPTSRVFEVNLGGVSVQGITPSASYARGLAKAVKDYIKAHPLRD